MNQAHMTHFLDTTIGRTVFPVPRLFAWDKFSCHTSPATMEYIKKLKLHSVIAPGGCIKFVQAPDVCWNAPF